MYTSLKLASTLGKNDHLLIFTKGKNDFDKQFFSAAEIRYISEKLKQNKKQVCINQLNRFIFIQVADVSKNKDTYHHLEEFRKAGAKWTQSQKGVYLTDHSFFEESGGIFQPSPHYEQMFKKNGK